MDRRSFIIHQNKDREIISNDCGLDNCECETADEKNKGEEENVSISLLLFLALVALICASLFPLLKNEANKLVVADIINQQKENSISCGPSNSSNFDVTKNHLPPDNNHKNCAHQSGSCLCETRRRLTKMMA